MARAKVSRRVMSDVGGKLSFDSGMMERARAELFDVGVEEGAATPDFVDADGGWGASAELDESVKERVDQRIHFLECKCEVLAQRMKYVEQLIVGVAQSVSGKKSVSMGA